jgi:hypothetical protein
MEAHFAQLKRALLHRERLQSLLQGQLAFIAYLEIAADLEAMALLAKRQGDPFQAVFEQRDTYGKAFSAGLQYLDDVRASA